MTLAHSQFVVEHRPPGAGAARRTGRPCTRLAASLAEAHLIAAELVGRRPGRGARRARRPHRGAAGRPVRARQLRADRLSETALRGGAVPRQQTDPPPGGGGNDARPNQGRAARPGSPDGGGGPAVRCRPQGRGGRPRSGASSRGRQDPRAGLTAPDTVGCEAMGARADTQATRRPRWRRPPGAPTGAAATGRSRPSTSPSSCRSTRPSCACWCATPATRTATSCASASGVARTAASAGRSSRSTRATGASSRPRSGPPR
jgi:hypothetical protein